MTTKTDITQDTLERADFEAWAEKRGVWPRLTHEEIFSAGYQAGRAALQSQKPEPNDLMLSGVIRMPFEMAMASEISRLQFYQRAQQALNELEALQSQDREDAERYRWLCDKFGITKLPCAIERIIAGDVYVADGKVGIDEAIDHARRIEGGERSHERAH
ncbi:MAG: hypothetical protein WCX93_00300 [Burkholderiaceae bacterium]